MKHPRNTFIIAQALGPRASKTFPIPKPWADEPIYMFRGSQIRELAVREAWSLKLVAWGLRILSAISCQYDKLSQALGACCLCQCDIMTRDKMSQLGAWRLGLSYFSLPPEPAARALGNR